MQNIKLFKQSADIENRFFFVKGAYRDEKVENHFLSDRRADVCHAADRLRGCGDLFRTEDGEGRLF
jgi:hypothetical protein